MSQMPTSNTLTYNFSDTPFDGGCRQAHQFRPFIMSQLQSEGLTWILNTKNFPTEEVPLKIKMIVKQQQKDTDLYIKAYEIDKKAYDRHLREYKAAIDNIMADEDTTEDQKARLLDIHEQDPQPDEPRVAFPMSELTPAMERTIQDVKFQNMEIQPSSQRCPNQLWKMKSSPQEKNYLRYGNG
jgi:hypothetical protein